MNRWLRQVGLLAANATPASSFAPRPECWQGGRERGAFPSSVDGKRGAEGAPRPGEGIGTLQGNAGPSPHFPLF